MRFSAGVCNLCGTGCGHFLQAIGGQVRAVAPHLAHPVSQGRLCMRGWHIHELLRSSRRLATPLIRDHGTLRPVSYEQAIQDVCQRLAALGDPAGKIGVIASPRASNEDNYLLAKLARDVFRATRVGVSSQASHGRTLHAMNEAFGVAGAVGSLADLEHARAILVVAGDLTRLNPIVGSNIHRAARRGARVVVLSSTRTQMARLATMHLQHAPGSKRVVVEGLSKAILAEGKARPALPGLEELERALAGLSPAAIEAETGIPYSAMCAEARSLLTSDSLMVVFSSGISGLDADTAAAVVNLALLSGKMGTPHSGVLPVSGICNLQGASDMGLVSTAEGADPFNAIGADPSPLEALLVVDHDDGVIRHRDRIARMGLVVYAGAFENRFTDLAHVVFPTAAFTDYPGTYTASDRRVQLSGAKTSAPGHAVPAWRLYRDLANGCGGNWRYAGEGEIFDEIARTIPGYAGLSHRELANGSGRHWGSQAPVRGRRFLPLAPTRPAPTAGDAFPFTLMVGQAQHFWHQNNLMRHTLTPRREYDAALLQYPEGYVELSAADAKRLQVRDNGRVAVASACGTVRMAVRVSDDLQDGTACIPYFVEEMISGFLLKHDVVATLNEDSVIPVRIEKV